MQMRNAVHRPLPDHLALAEHAAAKAQGLDRFDDRQLEIAVGQIGGDHQHPGPRVGLQRPGARAVEIVVPSQAKPMQRRRPAGRVGAGVEQPVGAVEQGGDGAVDLRPLLRCGDLGVEHRLELRPDFAGPHRGRREFGGGVEQRGHVAAAADDDAVRLARVERGRQAQIEGEGASAIAGIDQILAMHIGQKGNRRLIVDLRLKPLRLVRRSAVESPAAQAVPVGVVDIAFEGLGRVR